jgi:hypothetical protein
MYQQHPSHELKKLFARQPYQGAIPSSAKFLFVGLDANYSAGIENTPIFQNVLEYHQDGVSFWRRHGVHHPFLLSQYRGDGRRYHATFAKIGFKPEHAELVSFVELLHVPTIGRNKLSPEDLNPSHLQMLNSAILEGDAEHIFISAGVARLMRASGAFSWLPKAPTTLGSLPLLYKANQRAVYQYLHFSNYGKFQLQLEREASAIALLIPKLN